MTETTFRDAHQSLLATRVRTRDLSPSRRYVARMTPELLSVEAWGGATYDVALRFLGEDPWERLASLREALPNIAIQMLLRGRNTVGYTPYPTEVTDAFVREAAATGVDIFRIFDALNDVSQMRPAIESVLATGTTVAEVAVCYTGDLLDPAEDLYTLDYYLRLAEQIVDAGAHMLAIKDMAGLLRAGRRGEARRGVPRAVRPAGPRAHPRHRRRPARDAARREPRGRRRGRRRERPDGRHDEPAVGVRARRRPRPHRARHRHLAAGGLRSRALLGGRAPRLPAVRVGPARAPPAACTRTRSPAASCRTSASRRSRWASRDQFEQIEDMYAAANKILGRVAEGDARRRRSSATSRSHLAAVEGRPGGLRGRTPTSYDIPDSVDRVHGGRARRAAGRMAGAVPHRRCSPAAPSKIGVEPISPRTQTALDGDSAERRSTLNRLLFPAPTKQLRAGARAVRRPLGASTPPTTSTASARASSTSSRSTRACSLFVGLEAIGEADEKGMRTVMTTLNGQLRPVFVRDRSIEVDAEAAEKADASDARPGRRAVLRRRHAQGRARATASRRASRSPRSRP